MGRWRRRCTAHIGGGKHLGYCLSCLFADFELVETTTVDEVTADIAVPDMKGLGLGAPGFWNELNAETVGKLGLEGVAVGEVANKLGFHPVPIHGNSGETLVKVLKSPLMCDTSMFAVTDETVDKFLCEDTCLEDIAALAGKCWYDGLGAASSTTCCFCASWVRHVVGM